jgi:hypothetical protein
MIGPVRLNHPLRRWNQRFFQNLSPTIRTFRRFSQNVIRHARIGAGNAVENIIERGLGSFLIAMLSRLNEPLSVAESCGLDEHDNLLFWWLGRKSRRTLNRILAF